MIVRGGYEAADPDVAAVADAVRAHNELVNYILFVLLGLAETEQTSVIRARPMRGRRKKRLLWVHFATSTWGDVRDKVLVVDKALSLGDVKETKTRQTRTVRLLRPLATDLAKWRMVQGRPDDREPVFPMRDGRFWTDTAYRNWRRRIFEPAACAAGIENPRPYDLRHSLASLRFQEGGNPAEIAETMGHSIQTLLGTYTHVIEELRGQPGESAETLIRNARKRRGPQMAPNAAAAASNAEG